MDSVQLSSSEEEVLCKMVLLSYCDLQEDNLDHLIR